jgi:hypothetical protein
MIGFSEIGARRYVNRSAEPGEPTMTADVPRGLAGTAQDPNMDSTSGSDTQIGGAESYFEYIFACFSFRADAGGVTTFSGRLS